MQLRLFTTQLPARYRQQPTLTSMCGQIILIQNQLQIVFQINSRTAPAHTFQTQFTGILSLYPRGCLNHISAITQFCQLILYNQANRATSQRYQLRIFWDKSAVTAKYCLTDNAPAISVVLGAIPRYSDKSSAQPAHSWLCYHYTA